MIDLSEQMVNGLIGVGVTFLIGCLVVGVQVIFYTKNFQEEHGKKIDKIKTVLNWKLEKALQSLFKKRKFSLLEENEALKWTKVFPETIEDIRFKEGADTEVFPELILREEESLELVSLDDMEEIYENVRKLKRWSIASRETKDYLRKVGKFVILLGVVVLIGLTVFTTIPEIAILIIWIYVLTFTIIPIYQSCHKYIKLINEIEEIHEKIERRSPDI